jgi:hypothetical protein
MVIYQKPAPYPRQKIPHLQKFDGFQEYLLLLLIQVQNSISRRSLELSSKFQLSTPLPYYEITHPHPWHVCIINYGVGVGVDNCPEDQLKLNDG